MPVEAPQFLEPSEPQEEVSYDSSPTSVGLSLSGGGNRAALFGAGVVLALSDGGIAPRIKSVSSVSGGSLVNARLASELDWTEASASDVRQALAPLIQMICGTGFVVPGVVSFFSYFLLVVVVSAAAWSGLMALTTYGDWDFWAGLAIWGGLWGGAMALYVLHSGRQHLALRAYHSCFIGNKKVSDMVDGGTSHVICATDLETASHFFFTGYGLDSQQWGLASGDETPLWFAVECSAAFPLVFPVKSLRTRNLAFDPAKKVPKTLKLVDGGVHDNLGLPWLVRLLNSDELDAVIAVNSSWNRPYRRLGLLKTARVFSVMHQSNWAYRARKIEEQFVQSAIDNGVGSGALISIGESPDEFLDRVGADSEARGGALQTDLLGRVETARSFLRASGYTSEQLAILCRRAAGTKTTLGRVEDSRAQDLLVHGYLSSLVACHVLLNIDLPGQGTPPLEPFLTETPKAVRRKAYSLRIRDEARL